MNSNQERKKYDMQQAKIMKGGAVAAPSSSSSALLKREETTSVAAVVVELPQVYKALEDLDRAEHRVQRQDPSEISIEELEKARDIYREAIGILLNYMNQCQCHLKNNNDPQSRVAVKTAGNIATTATNTNNTTTNSNRIIQLDVLKERIKLALTHAEDIQEMIGQQRKKTQKSYNVVGKRTVLPFGLSRNRERQDSTQNRLLRSQSEKLHLGRKDRDEIHDSDVACGKLLASSMSADDAVVASSLSSSLGAVGRQPRRQQLQQQQQQRNHVQKRSHLDYKSNNPYIEIIKKEMYVDSKTLTATSWNDIAGLKSAKQALQEAAILPLLRPDLYTGLRSAPRGILLYGPPGTGKTMLVRAVAHESKCILFACSASSMTSKWVGESEKLVRTLFRMAEDVAPSIIFLDEMDALLSRRKSDGNTEQESSRRFKTEFMIQMDGLAAGGGSNRHDNDNHDEHKKKVHVPYPKTLLIGCTNCPWDVDDAVMRRFQRRIYIPLPDKAARMTLWKKLIDKSKESVKLHSRDLEKLVQISQGFSCSDISAIANEAAFGPLRDLGSIEAIRDVSIRDVRPIQMKDFEEAIQNAKKSVSVALLNKYEEWEKEQSTIKV